MVPVEEQLYQELIEKIKSYHPSDDFSMVEKAYHEINGAYAIINRDFALNCFTQFELINREDDMGIENLRKAKMSYFPTEIRNKYLAQSR